MDCDRKVRTKPTFFVRGHRRNGSSVGRRLLYPEDRTAGQSPPIAHAGKFPLFFHFAMPGAGRKVELAADRRIPVDSAGDGRTCCGVRPPSGDRRRWGWTFQGRRCNPSATTTCWRRSPKAAWAPSTRAAIAPPGEIVAVKIMPPHMAAQRRPAQALRAGVPRRQPARPSQHRPRPRLRRVRAARRSW